MIRFLLGLVLGAAGGMYLLAVLLTSSRETTTTAPTYVWPPADVDFGFVGTLDDRTQWTYTDTPAT